MAHHFHQRTRPSVLLYSVFYSMLLIFLKFIPLAITALLPVVNPVGSALLFLSMTMNADHATRRQMARKIALNSTLFLAAVEFSGNVVLQFFGLALPVVQVAGGIVVATIGWNLLNQPDPGPGVGNPPLPLDALKQRLFYPLTFPISVGPGCIVVMLTLSAHAALPGWGASAMAHLALLAGVAVMGILLYLAYAHADGLLRKISPQMAHGIMRVIDFLLVCIGFQILWNGLHTLLKLH